MSKEIWCVIPSHPKYEASSLGRIRNRKTGKIRKLTRDNRLGYLRVCVNAGFKKNAHPSVHRLILETFRGPAPVGTVACHNNGQHADNRIENLRWDTMQANIDDRRDHGRTATKFSEGDVLLMRKLYDDNYGIRTIAKRFNTGSSTVSQIVRGIRWPHLPLGKGPSMSKSEKISRALTRRGKGAPVLASRQAPR